MFEMDKRYRETLLQLQLSPVILRSGIATVDGKKSGDLSQGHLLLTGLQFRGHAMFSEIERPLGSDTIEYAWLIEIQCGSLFGKITAAQVCCCHDYADSKKRIIFKFDLFTPVYILMKELFYRIFHW